MTLAEAVSRLEALAAEVSHDHGYREADGTTRLDLTPLGDEYLTFVAGGVKRQGDPMPRWYPNQVAAVTAWFATVRSRNPTPSVGGGKLWWRELPEIVRSTEILHRLEAQGETSTRPPAAYQVWSRLYWGAVDDTERLTPGASFMGRKPRA